MELALVALGGAVGAVGRYLTQLAVARLSPTLPWGTLAVNVVGCFAIGVLLPQLARLPPSVKPLVIVGFLGGLTTMSSYAGEVVLLKDEGRLAAAVVYGVGVVVACVGAAALGFGLGRGLGPGDG